MKDSKERMKELAGILNEAAKAYYQESREIMPNIEYDRLYDELSLLEEETGIVLAGSPTRKVGYEVLSELPKEAHQSPMLSLDKTKDREALAAWLGDRKGLLSWKLDGLTIVLTYQEGSLIKAVTRGNGEIGEVITANAKTFENIPVTIAFKGTLTLRGEAIIKYSDFEKINAAIAEGDARYKNPRNLCSGSVRQLSSRITAERRVNFFAFSLVQAEGVDFENSRENQMRWLESQGFDIVEYKVVSGEKEGSLRSALNFFEEKIKTSDLPSDGLVLTFDDIEYGRRLGNTAKFPRDSIAFKWKDEIADTTLREVEWSASRTGLINPVAIFDPVEIEGSTVSRASVHNVSIVRQLKLGIGDTISVYKANMIIPQIAENKTESGSLEIPDRCPVCGGPSEIQNEKGVETLYCINPDCLAKQIKSLVLFVSRNAMNIEGLSEATIEKLVGKGLIKETADLFRIEKYREEIVEMEGFGEKSFDNLKASVNKARKTTGPRFLYSLGIPGIGAANARLISRFCGGSWDRMKSITREELLAIDGIGGIMAENYRAFFDDENKLRMAEDIYREITIEEKPPRQGGQLEFLFSEDEAATEEADSNDNAAQRPRENLEGRTFVITGALNRFENRNVLKELIEDLEGKVSGSVSKKTDFLINNDNMSSSSKNKAAKELGIPIITEEEFIERFLSPALGS